MTIEEFSKLEEKVNKLVNTIKILRDENKQLKLDIENLSKESNVLDKERVEIKNKVTSLIALIESIE